MNAKLPSLILPAVLHLLLPTLAFAQDDFFGNREISINTGNNSEHPWELTGWITGKLAYGLASPGPGFSRRQSDLSKVETSGFAQLDWRLSDAVGLRVSGKAYRDFIYQIDDDSPYSRAERDEFQTRYELRDFYLEAQLGDRVYLKIGNQILAWGMSEYLRVTDVINTEDQYTLGQQDLEDLRLQVPALLLGVNRGDWLFESVVTHRAGSNDLAPAGDEFDQLIDLRGTGLALSKHDAGNPWEYLLRASTHYGAGDIQLVAGEFNDNQLTFAGLRTSTSGAVVADLQPQRMQLLGGAVNHVAGSWLWFGESAMHYNRPLVPDRRSALLSPVAWEEKNQWLSALGAEYNGFSNLILTLEIDSQRIVNPGNTDFASRQQTSIGTRFYWTSRNERLAVLGVWNRLDKGKGYLTRLSLDYDWSDQLSLGALWVNYGANRDSLLYNFRNNDVFQLQMRYSFQH